MSSNNATKAYDSSSIVVLKGLAPVRKRPAMYIGSTCTKGIFHLFKEIFDNSLDEAEEGHCSVIDVYIHDDGKVSVRDNGRGIPIDMHEQEGVCAATLVFTELHAGGKFDESNYQFSGGMHGVGASCVNALSDYLHLEVRKNGKTHSLKFTNSVPETTMPIIIGDCDENDTGTLITYRPAEYLFEDAINENGFEIHFDMIDKYLSDKAALSSGITINLDYKGKQHKYYSENGIVDLLALPEVDETTVQLSSEAILFKETYIHKDRRVVSETGTGKHGQTEVVNERIETEIAMFFFNKYGNPYIRSFVNNLETTTHGKHVSGMRATLFEVILQYAKTKCAVKQIFTPEDVLAGGFFVVSQKMENAQFGGQTKQTLSSSKGGTASKAALKDNFSRHLDMNPEFANALVSKCVNAAISREKLDKARLENEREAVTVSASLTGKLSNCRSRNLEENELILVEGESAGGSAKQARCKMTQAVLPLKGKVLNTHKSDIDRIINSEQIQNLYTAIGTRISHDYDYSKLRYGKIVIMCDADVDGGHIQLLLLTLFYRYMPDLIRKGHIFVAVPPLYKLEPKSGKGKNLYFKDDEELLQMFPDGTPNKYSQSRFKGLGEMTSRQLKETTMDKSKRKLLRIDFDEQEKDQVDALFETLMGADVPPRRAFIEKYANFNDVA